MKVNDVPKWARPKNCRGIYVPWVCGFCTALRKCKPRELARYERKVR